MTTYFTGDTHGTWDEREKFFKNLNPDDRVIVLGDFGWNWDINHINGFIPNCEWLSVLGNHENYNLVEQMPIEERYGGKVRKMKDNVYFLLNGEYYNIDGHTMFVFGGALSIDMHYRTPYVSWWPQEIPSSKDYENAMTNLEKNGWTMDFLLTHTCEDRLAKDMFGYEYVIYDPTARMIEEIKNSIAEHKGHYGYHLFGHHHDNVTKGNCICMFEDIYDIEMHKVAYDTGDYYGE